MPQEPIFLIVDNICDNLKSQAEAKKYLSATSHEKSRILITSRFVSVVKDILLEEEYYIPMPALKKEEAAHLFLQKGGKTYASLTCLEKTKVEYYIEKTHLSCSAFSWPSCGQEVYHPLALRALGAFLFKEGGDGISSWKIVFEDEEFASPTDYSWIYKILDLQFTVFGKTTQLLFLDVALYLELWSENPYTGSLSHEYMIDWLAVIDEDSIDQVYTKVSYLLQGPPLKEAIM